MADRGTETADRESPPFTDTGRGNRVTHDVVEPQNLYVEREDQTLVTWQGREMDPYIKAYDHSTGQWSDGYRVGDNPLYDDTHGAPVIAVGDDGHYHVMFGIHSTDIQYARSDAPYDITSWSQRTINQGEDATYTHMYPVNDAEDIYVLYREGPTNHDGRLRVISSGDGGRTWSAPMTVVDGGGDSPRPYSSAYDRRNNRFHVTWGLNTRSGVFDVYHAYLDPSDDTMYSMDGTDLGTTVTRVEAKNHCLVKGTDILWHTRSRVRLDETRTPHVLFTDTVDGTLSWRYTHWNQDGWSQPETVVSDVSETESADLYVRDADDIEAYVSVGQTELETWTYDGSSWRKDETILSNSGAYTTEKGWNPRIVKAGRSDVHVTFSESSGSDPSGLKAWAYGAGRFF